MCVPSSIRIEMYIVLINLFFHHSDARRCATRIRHRPSNANGELPCRPISLCPSLPSLFLSISLSLLLSLPLTHLLIPLRFCVIPFLIFIPFRQNASGMRECVFTSIQMLTTQSSVICRVRRIDNWYSCSILSRDAIKLVVHSHICVCRRRRSVIHPDPVFNTYMWARRYLSRAFIHSFSMYLIFFWLFLLFIFSLSHGTFEFLFTSLDDFWSHRNFLLHN